VTQQSATTSSEEVLRQLIATLKMHVKRYPDLHHLLKQMEDAARAPIGSNRVDLLLDAFMMVPENPPGESELFLNFHFAVARAYELASQENDARELQGFKLRIFGGTDDPGK